MVGFKKHLVFVVCLFAAVHARADLVSSLGSVSAPGSVAFANTPVTGTSSTNGEGMSFNFLDNWSFTLVSDSVVTGLSSGFLFDDGAGGFPTFGINNLQVRLKDASNGVVAVGWQTVTYSGPLLQTVSITPASGLTAGAYSMEVRGLISGSAAYSGALVAAQPAAVPLPLPAALLASGAGFMAWVARRRTRAAI